VREEVGGAERGESRGGAGQVGEERGGDELGLDTIPGHGVSGVGDWIETGVPGYSTDFWSTLLTSR
jgi:hypothetical protein